MQDKLAEFDLTRPRDIVIPKGVDPTQYHEAASQKAVMQYYLSPGKQAVLVDCPYCIIFWRFKNPVDITKFVEQDGTKECITGCFKGHTLRFRSMDEWRSLRQRLGLQRR